MVDVAIEADSPLPLASQPWSQRVVAAAPVAPAWVGVGVALGNVALCLVYFSIVGFPAPGGIWGAIFWQTLGGVACTMSALIGFAIAATAYSGRASMRAVHDLRPVLKGSETDLATLVDEITTFDRKRLRAIGLCVVLVGVPFIILDVWRFSMPQNVTFGVPVLFWVVWVNSLLFWHLSRSLVHELAVARRFSQIGAEQVEIDLLNLRSLAPFARRGLQSSLVWIVSISVFTVQFSVGWGVEHLPHVLALMTGFAAIVLLLPALGVHRSIVEAKDRELTRVSAEIRPLRETLLASAPGDAPEAVAQLSVLLALRQQLESAREWPFDVPTLLRFALYLALGLGSWLGAALVERGVDAALS